MGDDAGTSRVREERDGVGAREVGDRDHAPLAPADPVAPATLANYETEVKRLTAGCAVIVLAPAFRHRMPMASSILLMVLVTLVASLLRMALSRGYLVDMLWTRFGYQFALVVTAAVLMVGLISRIDDFRLQRDRDRLARVDTERRMAREAARGVLPNSTETKIVVTMNARELRHFFQVRCCNRAQWEIRELAWEMRGMVKDLAPNLFEGSGPGCLCYGTEKPLPLVVCP